MKKKLFVYIFILLNILGFSQKYSTKTGTIHFEASVPLFEDVNAKNSTVIAVLNSTTGELASVAVVKNFKFKNALMEEHFNENYAESAKFPKATFSGKILNLKKNDLSTTPKNYTLSGTLNFHGVNRTIQSTASVYIKNEIIYITGKFVTKPVDYKIKIPKMVMKKVAETVTVDYNYTLTP